MTRTHMLSVHTLSCPLCVCSYTEFSPLCLCPYMVMGSGGYAGAPRCGVGLPEASPEAPILESPTLGHVRPPQEDAGAAGRGLRLRRRRHGVGRAFDCNGKRESEEFSSELPSISVLDFLPLFSLFLPLPLTPNPS